MRIHCLFLLFLSAPLFTTAQAGRDEKAILEVLNTQLQAWNRGDIDAFMKSYWNSDSLMFIGKSGVTYGYTNTLNNYRKNYSDTARMGRLFFDVLKIKMLSPGYCWVLGKWYLRRSIGDIGGYYTLLFRKINGKWLIIADHTS